MANYKADLSGFESWFNNDKGNAAAYSSQPVVFTVKSILSLWQVQFLQKYQQKISYSDKMKVKIDSFIGRRQYSKRLGAIEPVFGNITVNKAMNKFTSVTRKSEFPVVNVFLVS